MVGLGQVVAVEQGVAREDQGLEDVVGAGSLHRLGSDPRRVEVLTYSTPPLGSVTARFGLLKSVTATGGPPPSEMLASDWINTVAGAERLVSRPVTSTLMKSPLALGTCRSVWVPVTPPARVLKEPYC